MNTTTNPRPTYRHVLEPLRVLADPEHKGKHPCHDSRYVTTANASFEEPRHPHEWLLENGSIICQMRDCEHQAQYARLFAQSPKMLELLRSTTAWIRKAGGDCETLDAFLSQFQDTL